MKKAILILVALMLLTAFAIPAFAADTEVSLTTANDIYYRGDEVTVAVSVSGDVPYTILKCQVVFDENVFEYVGYTASTDVPAEIFRFNEDKKSFAMTFRAPTAYAGEIGTITLRIKQDVSLDPTTISVSAEATDTVSDPEKDIILPVVSGSAQIAINCRHNYTWANTDEQTHTGTCTLCTDVKSENHIWADESINITPATCTEPGSETFECLICQTQKVDVLNAKGHAWDNDCDPDCNNECGETREAGHQYAETLTKDDTGHWYACSVCGDKSEFAEHIPGPEATEKDPQVCTVCGQVIKPALGHVHDFSTEWQQDADYHWHICLKTGCYGRQENGAHEYTDVCDVTCNVCGHVRVAPHQYSFEWMGSAVGHWHECLVCGNDSEIVAHIPGDPPTETDPQVCTECQFWLKYPLSHEHTMGDDWGRDDENHWKYCTDCSERLEVAPHDWDEGTVIAQPTETEEGSIRYICKDCEKVRMDVLPSTGSATQPTESEPTQTPSDPTDTQPSVTPPQNDEFPWWILVALAGVLLFVGIILFIIELVRSKTHNSRGKYSR